MNRYSDFYLNNIRLILLTKYNYKSLNDIDSLNRVDISISVKDQKSLLPSLVSLLLLSNKGLVSFNNSSSKNQYKSSQNTGSRMLVSSIHGDYIFNFIENMVNYYIPRIRYFKGFSTTTLNSFGNFSILAQDLMVFPELEEELELFYRLRGLQINFISSNEIKSNPNFFYSLFGFHFLN